MARQVLRTPGKINANSLVTAVMDSSDLKGAKVARILATDLPELAGNSQDISIALKGCVACSTEHLDSDGSFLARTFRDGSRTVILFASSAQISPECLDGERSLVEKNMGNLRADNLGEKATERTSR